ncbi:MAG: transglycosylase SLT domain-containing protein [Prevotella sp.]|nr:transglycosylase SLT domain-containing protein [Prevotella sp.]
MKTKLLASVLFLLTILFFSCADKKKTQVTPWGTPMGADSISSAQTYRLDDIVSNGELIMLTLSGPDTYYDYHGHGMGLQYLLCEKFAQKIGVSLRVDVCKDTLELERKLRKGEADIAALQFDRPLRGLRFTKVKADQAKMGWAVMADNAELADSLDRWFNPQMVKNIRNEEAFLLSSRSISRHVYSPMLNRSGGVISHYDRYFQMYAPMARIDWRLMAAQCYQESCFDPNAKSWAGACGLMQIMPVTADHLGLPRSEMFNPEQNIAASARYLQELGNHYRDVPVSERVFYQLASYNGGFFHIRDAMALARKNGRNPYRWDDVAEYVLKLSDAAYYRDPVVKHGYMRGTETVGYVRRIRDRWMQYRGVARGGVVPGGGTVVAPQRASRNYKWHL